MKLKKQILVILSALFPLIMPAQVVKKSYTLDEVIQLALERSPDAMMAKHRLRGSYWRYKSHKASTLPYISLDATLPSYDRSVKYNIRDDGTYAFQDVNNITTGGDLSIRQYIGPTGTSIFLRSSLNRYAYLQDTSWVSSYFSNPIQLQVVQPIFKFNKFKWDRKIEPLHYNEAIQSYLQQREGVIIKAINVFFDLLAAQTTESIRQLFAFQAKRIGEYYQRALDYLPPSDRYAQYSLLIRLDLAMTLLAELAEEGYRLLEQQTRLTPLRKLWLAWCLKRREQQRYRHLAKA